MSPQKFKAVREKLGLTQTELADALGLSGHKPVSHFETGFRTPSLLTQVLMSILDSLSERKAADMLELFREHMDKVRKAANRKSNARD